MTQHTNTAPADVWVATSHRAYEGGYVLGIAATTERGQQIAHESYMQDNADYRSHAGTDLPALKWVEEATTSYRADINDEHREGETDYFTVQRYQVQPGPAMTEHTSNGSVVRVVQTRVVRPDGNLIYTGTTYTGTTSDEMAPRFPIDEAGRLYIDNDTSAVAVLPPWLWQVREQDSGWTTVDERPDAEVAP
jgi:hypothetical protein